MERGHVEAVTWFLMTTILSQTRSKPVVDGQVFKRTSHARDKCDDHKAAHRLYQRKDACPDGQMFKQAIPVHEWREIKAAHRLCQE